MQLTGIDWSILAPDAGLEMLIDQCRDHRVDLMVEFEFESEWKA